MLIGSRQLVSARGERVQAIYISVELLSLMNGHAHQKVSTV